MSEIYAVNESFFKMILSRHSLGAKHLVIPAPDVGALRLAVQEGDKERGSFLCGQVAAMVNKTQPAAEIIREVIEGAEPILKGASQWVK